MEDPKKVLAIAKNIQQELYEFGIIESKIAEEAPVIDTYDLVVTNIVLKRKTEKLFKDGHHPRAVEEAYKLLDNVVKRKSGLELTGAKLMNTAFSSNNPVLWLNEGISQSEKNEQLGYMQIFAGCMTGIRNPRAHDSDWEDTEQRALQLLAFANHLIERAMLSQKRSKNISTNNEQED